MKIGEHTWNQSCSWHSSATEELCLLQQHIALSVLALHKFYTILKNKCLHDTKFLHSLKFQREIHLQINILYLVLFLKFSKIYQIPAQSQSVIFIIFCLISVSSSFFIPIFMNQSDHFRYRFYFFFPQLAVLKLIAPVVDQRTSLCYPSFARRESMF